MLACRAVGSTRCVLGSPSRTVCQPPRRHCLQARALPALVPVNQAFSQLVPPSVAWLRSLVTPTVLTCAGSRTYRDALGPFGPGPVGRACRDRIAGQYPQRILGEPIECSKEPAALAMLVSR